ncbi:BRCA1-associated RING domain protein 1 [Dimargaris cristalligena]|uniref:BRCT domain-containing protein n=1 Tax=Dimargaris cristalligena TaxID=215637 RepID=A0A4P9ZXD9_9FUNG|nr:BRCA1-associated RING domain protein 1 [Dimargaris cristalligena]RKP37562.1 hypothetical protein BJ085DRAFT_40275 [Dimargaris cristalligena]|eukprot:RKP37562.1 hypothetical protein BJ085DRAFT_40275 [Dimargaris cristalligena]
MVDPGVRRPSTKCIDDYLGTESVCPQCQLPVRAGNLRHCPTYDTLVECLKAIYQLVGSDRPTQLSQRDLTALDHLIQSEAVQTQYHDQPSPFVTPRKKAAPPPPPLSTTAPSMAASSSNPSSQSTASSHSAQSNRTLLDQLSAAAAFLTTTSPSRMRRRRSQGFATKPSSTSTPPILAPPTSASTTSAPIPVPSPTTLPSTTIPTASPETRCPFSKSTPATHFAIPTVPSHSSSSFPSDTFEFSISPSRPNPMWSSLMNHPTSSEPWLDALDDTSSIVSLPEVELLLGKNTQPSNPPPLVLDEAPDDAQSTTSIDLARSHASEPDHDLDSVDWKQKSTKNSRTYTRTGRRTFSPRKRAKILLESDDDEPWASPIPSPTLQPMVVIEPTNPTKATSTLVAAQGSRSSRRKSLPPASTSNDNSRISESQEVLLPSASQRELFEARIVITSVTGAKLTQLDVNVQKSVLSPGFFKVALVNDFPTRNPLARPTKGKTIQTGVTHVVTVLDKHRHCPRTLKYMYGVLSACKVVDYKWVIDCVAAHKYIPETDYEAVADSTYLKLVKDQLAPARSPPLGSIAAIQALLSSSDETTSPPQLLFHGLTFYIDRGIPGQPQSGTAVDPAVVKNLVQFGGGKAVDGFPDLARFQTADKPLAAKKSRRRSSTSLQPKPLDPALPIIIDLVNHSASLKLNPKATAITANSSTPSKSTRRSSLKTPLSKDHPLDTRLDGSDPSLTLTVQAQTRTWCTGKIGDYVMTGEIRTPRLASATSAVTTRPDPGHRGNLVPLEPVDITGSVVPAAASAIESISQLPTSRPGTPG